MASLLHTGSRVASQSLPAGPLALTVTSTGPLAGLVRVFVAGGPAVAATPVPGPEGTPVLLDLTGAAPGPATLVLVVVSASNRRTYTSEHPVILTAPPLPYERPDGWESWPVKRATGATTATFMETISGDGGPLVVELPYDRAVPPLRVHRFTDLLMVGGAIRALPGSNLAGQAQRMLYLPEIVGTAHLEGVHLDAVNVVGAETDGIAFNGPVGTLRIRGCRIAGLRGTLAGNHADGLQVWNGIGWVDVEDLTITTNYQAVKAQLTAADKARGRRVGRMDLSRVNMRNLDASELKGIAPTQGAHHLWFDPEPGPQGGPDVTLREVYSDGPQRLGFRLWPRQDQPDRHGCTVTGGRATWPPAMKIDGCVIDGPPPGGDFVPADRAGLAYSHRLRLAG